MNWLIVVLRFAHIVSGALWVGMLAFTVFFLSPALAEVGPDSGKVMAALQRRRLMVVMPVIALITIISGFWMMAKLYGGSGGFMGTRMGMTLSIGALSALLAFVVGIVAMRPIMTRLATTTDPAEAARLRARSATVSRIVVWLVLLAVAAMAVARYV